MREFGEFRLGSWNIPVLLVRGQIRTFPCRVLSVPKPEQCSRLRGNDGFPTGGQVSKGLVVFPGWRGGWVSFGELPASRVGSFCRWQGSTEPGLGGPSVRPELQGTGCYWEGRGAWALPSRAFLTSLASLPPGSPGLGASQQGCPQAVRELSGLV